MSLRSPLWIFILYVFFVQTDMMDLLGSDLPVESDEGMKFSLGCYCRLKYLTMKSQNMMLT